MANGSLQTLIDLLGRPEFHVGLLAGVASYLIIWTVRPGGKGYALALSAATVIGVNLTVGRRASTTLGLVALAIGGFILEHRGRREDVKSLAWVVIAGGAILATARGGLPETLWIQFLAPVVIVAIGFWLSRWSELPQNYLLGPLLLITAFGIWTTVPDTDSARVLLGAAIPLCFATLHQRGLQIAAAGAFPLAGVLVWVSATGGLGRHGSLVGALGCIGVLLVLPLLGEAAASVRGLFVLITHAAVVLLSSRVFGLFDSAVSAGLGVVVINAAAYVALRSLSLTQRSEVSRQSI